MSNQFDAFISYRRSDGATAARRVRRLLQDYRAPKSLRGQAPQSLKVFLDTIYESATNDFFENSIRPALLASRNLIVLATPDASDRGAGVTDWIRREIAEFESGPNAGNILVVRVSGDWRDPLPGDLALRYPNIEIIDLRGLTSFAFLNPAKSRRLTDETVKLVAPLLGLQSEHMPALRQEEERRQQTRLAVSAGAFSAVLLAIAGLSIFAFLSRNRAIDALTKSTFAADRVIQAVASSMPAGELQSELLMTSCDLLDSLTLQAGRQSSSGSVVACAVERATSREAVGESDAAQKLLLSAQALVVSRFNASKLGDDAFALIDIDERMLKNGIGQNDAGAKRAALAAFISESRRIVDALPEEKTLASASARALQEASVTLGGQDLYEAALGAVEASLEMWAVAAKRNADPGVSIEYASAYALKAKLHAELRQGELKTAAVNMGRNLLNSIGNLDPNQKSRLDEVRALLAEANVEPPIAKGSK